MSLITTTMPYEPTTRNIVRFILVLTRAYPLKTDLHRFLVSSKPSISFLKLQSALIVIQSIPVILQCKLFAPRHEVITVYTHERTGFAYCHLLTFVDNHNHNPLVQQ